MNGYEASHSVRQCTSARVVLLLGMGKPKHGDNPQTESDNNVVILYILVTPDSK